MERLGRDRARRLALGAQGFNDPAPTGRVDRRHLRRVMGRMGLVQLDSVPVVVRSQYLPFYARLGPYPTRLVDDIAYRHDEWFEAWAHEASLLPVTDEPYLRWAKQRAEAGGTWKGLVRLARDDPAYVDRVLAEVGERGPLLAGELTDPRPRSGDWWDGRSVGRLALDWLFRTGRVGIRRVGNFEKQWDLLDRIVPADVRARPTPPVDEAQRHLVDRAARALGVATAKDLADYHRMPVGEARQRVAELVEEGTLLPCRVEGWRLEAWVHADATVPRRIRARALLSPFDPVVWNRERASRIFDFEYRIEIYVPRADRTHGYYVLPFLLGDRLVARVDVKTDRRAGVLRALATHAEPGVEPTHVAHELASELGRLAELVGVDDVVAVPAGDLGPAVVRALGTRTAPTTLD